MLAQQCLGCTNWRKQLKVSVGAWAGLSPEGKLMPQQAPPRMNSQETLYQPLQSLSVEEWHAYHRDR